MVVTFSKTSELINFYRKFNNLYLKNFSLQLDLEVNSEFLKTKSEKQEEYAGSSLALDQTFFSYKCRGETKGPLSVLLVLCDFFFERILLWFFEFHAFLAIFFTWQQKILFEKLSF